MPTVIPVRMHFSAQDLWFKPGNTGARAGDHVIVNTERGTEFGLATADPFSVPDSECKGKGELKSVVRIANDSDIARAEKLAAQGEEAMPTFRKLVKESNLDIKPVGVEFLFGGEKAVFYFAAEDRVDFRDLVRDLAGAFHQRVDMRQIGVRDEARLAGGYAPCGQELCCVRFGGQFEPVSIRMAKEQDLPLNSSKISGVCGRLMCCLRYEFEAYRDFKQRAPKKNNLIDTPLGKAKIVEYNTPKETLLLRLENGKSFTIALKDMTCSEGCCKRAKEQNIPLRPDTVTREALEALGTAEIAMQLAELDRKNGEGDGFALDMSLLEPSRTPRRRRSGADAGEQKDEKRTPRRSSKQAQPDKEQADKPAEQGEGEQRRGPRGGGMRPRRTRSGEPKGTEQQTRAKRDEQAGGTDAPKPARKQRQEDGAERRKRSTSQPAKDGQAAPETQKRTRRHHSAQTTQATQAAQPQAGQVAKPQGQDAPQGGDAPRTRRRQHQGANQQAGRGQDAKPRDERQEPRGPEADKEGAQRQAGQRRRHTAKPPRPSEGANPPADGPASSGSQPATRRRRKPGDKGGAAE